MGYLLMCEYRLDYLNRIRIPREYLDKMQIPAYGFLSMAYENGSLILRKWNDQCVFCGSQELFCLYRNQFVCANCFKGLVKHLEK